MTLRRFSQVMLYGFLGFAFIQLTPIGFLSPGYAGSDKVTICHIPPGNPANPQTITVGESAVRAHLAHGDSLGQCAECECTSDDNPCTVAPCNAAGVCAELVCEDGDACDPDSELGCDTIEDIPNCSTYDRDTNTVTESLCVECQANCSDDACKIACTRTFGCRIECVVQP